MKKLSFILFVILTWFSCTETRQDNVDQTTKEKITKDVESTLHQILDGWNAMDISKSFALFSNSDEFIFIGVDGTVGNYSSFIDMSKEMFSSWKNAKFNLLDYKIKILNKELVVAALVYSGEITYPDLTIEKYPKVGSTLILHLKNDKWIVTHFQESSLSPEVIKQEKK